MRSAGIWRKGDDRTGRTRNRNSRAACTKHLHHQADCKHESTSPLSLTGCAVETKSPTRRLRVVLQTSAQWGIQMKVLLLAPDLRCSAIADLSCIAVNGVAENGPSARNSSNLHQMCAPSSQTASERERATHGGNRPYCHQEGSVFAPSDMRHSITASPAVRLLGFLVTRWLRPGSSQQGASKNHRSWVSITLTVLTKGHLRAQRRASRPKTLVRSLGKHRPTS
jgi:hypothetical protein